MGRSAARKAGSRIDYPAHAVRPPIPGGQRRRWLRKLADALDGDRAKQRHRARQAHHRQPHRAGLRVHRLELADRVMEDVISALITYGRLSEADTLRRAAVERTLVEIIRDVGRPHGAPDEEERWPSIFRGVG